MVFNHIESLKQQFTDKYVVVDETRPELARFRGLAGQIRTVNMSGRALVEFEAYNNIGWYDIDLDFLKVVDQPPPKPAEEHAKPPKAATAKPATAKPATAKPATAKPATAKPAAKPKVEAATGEKKLSPLEMARAQGAAKKTGDAPKQSTSDILAAARAGKSPATAQKASAAQAEAAPAPAAAGVAKKLSTAEIIAAARAKKSADAALAAPEAAPAQTAAGTPAATKPTTAEILAAARRKVEPPAETAAATVEAPPVAQEPAAESVAAPEKPAQAAPAGELPKTTAARIAWCRQHDAK